MIASPVTEPCTLSDEHRKRIEDSAISPEVAKARGYRTVDSKAELSRLGFATNQLRVPALLVPLHDITGAIASYQIRPDTPRETKGKVLKYETPAKSRMYLDVPLHAREMLGDPSIPLFITEGARKADAAVTAGLCCIALLGVWNWRGTNEQGGKTALPDWESIALKERTVYIAFDSDVMEKQEVHRALGRLKGFLEQRGASVRAIYLPHGPHGEKQGLDDFFAAGGTVQTLLSYAQEGVRALPQTQTAGDVFPECPCPAMIVPHNYTLRTDGVYYLPDNDDGEARRITHGPLLLVGQAGDIDTGEFALKIAWLVDGRWVTETADRTTLAQAREITGLAARGAPVNSTNAAEVVRYIAAAEAANGGDALPRERTTGHMGWQDGGKGFLVGADYYGDGKVTFRPMQEGDEQLARGFTTAGTLDKWLEMAREAVQYPRVRAVLYAALTPPLLEIVGAPNFVMDLAQRTSTGKTTTLKIGASVWGNPDERTEDSVMSNWDATKVYNERTSTVITGMPLILDDTKRARHTKAVAGIVYEVVNGRGRGRGTKNGTARTGSWHTVMLSSGEQPVTSFTEDGGTRTRCLVVRGNPWGATSAETRGTVERQRDTVHANYGHAGRLFVESLVANRDQWDVFKKLYQRYKQGYAEQASSEEGYRLAEYAGVVRLAAVLFNTVLRNRDIAPLESDDEPDPFGGGLWEQVVAEATGASGGERALRDVISWAHMNHEAFYDAERDVDRVMQPCFGRWDSDVIGEDSVLRPPRFGGHLCILPDPLKRELTVRGYQPDGIIDEWKERGWLLADPGRRDKKVRINSIPPTDKAAVRQVPRCIVISRAAIDEIEGTLEPSDLR